MPPHLERKGIPSSRFPDMRLLNEVTQSPQATQRDLSRRMGVALGLTNLILRRLIKKGFIKIANTKKSRIRYLITPRGMIEKARLTREYIEYSLYFYREIRVFLKEHLSRLAQDGHRRVLLYGTGELAEITLFAMEETGLELVAVIDETTDRKRFLGHPVHGIGYAAEAEYDRILVASLAPREQVTRQLGLLGIPPDRLLILPHPGQPIPRVTSMTRGGIGTSLESEPQRPELKTQALTQESAA